MEIREVNLQFNARQAVIYPVTGDPERHDGDNFTKFEFLQALIETALIKTPEKIEAEKVAQIAEIDKTIATLTAQKETLVKNEPIKEDI